MKSIVALSFVSLFLLLLINCAQIEPEECCENLNNLNNNNQELSDAEVLPAKISVVDVFCMIHQDHFINFALSFVPHEIPVLAVLNKNLFDQCIRTGVFQKFLAFKYRLPALKRIPFDKKLLRLEAPIYLKNPFYGKLLKPKNLHRRLELSFEESPAMQELTLVLYDHFAEDSINRLFLTVNSGVKASAVNYAEYACSVILKHRNLTYFRKLKKHFLKAINVQKALVNSSGSFSKWFLEERAEFISEFFDPSFEWDKNLLLKFLRAYGTSLDPNISIEQAKSFLKALNKLCADVEFNEPDFDSTICDKCMPYFEAHATEIDAQAALHFKVRFCQDYELTLPQNLSQLDRSQLIQMQVFAAKFDDAIDALNDSAYRLQEPCICAILTRPEFCFYLISHSPKIYNWHFESFPIEFYTERKGMQAILKTKGVKSVSGLVKKMNNRYTQEHRNVLSLVLTFGNREDFKAIMQPIADGNLNGILNEIVQLMQIDSELAEYVNIFKAATFRSITANTLSLDSLKKLTAFPEALKVLQIFKAKVKALEADHEKLTESPEFKSTSEEIQSALQGFFAN